MFTFLEDCDDEIRDDMIFLEACEVASERACLAANVAGKLDALNQRASSIQAAAKGNDFDSLVAFYEEAETSNKKNPGLIKRAWEAVKKFFRTIKDKLCGASAKNIPDGAKGKVPEFFKNAGASVAKIFNAIKEFLSGHKVASLVSALIAVGGGAAIFKYVAAKKAGDDEEKDVKTIEVDGKWAKKFNDDMKQATDNITALTDQLAEAETNDILTEEDKTAIRNRLNQASAILGMVGISVPTNEGTGIWATIRGILNTIGSFFKSAWAKIKSKVKIGGGEGGEGEMKEESWTESWNEIDKMLGLSGF